MSLSNRGKSDSEEFIVTFCILSPVELPAEIKESEKCRYRCYKSKDAAENALKRYQEIYHQSLDLVIQPVRIIKGE